MQEMWETQVQSLGWEDPLEKVMATHSSILAEETHAQRSLEDYSPQICKRLKPLSMHNLYNIVQNHTSVKIN